MLVFKKFTLNLILFLTFYFYNIIRWSLFLHLVYKTEAENYALYTFIIRENGLRFFMESSSYERMSRLIGISKNKGAIITASGHYI